MPKTFKNISLWQPGGLFGWGVLGLGNPATSERSVAFRPHLAMSLALSCMSK